ncbi:MAG TPA: hypothetical protein VFS20_24305 [Longimicrobium sp.]|nr:hypothetical protein [Longimicrobium sp.]
MPRFRNHFAPLVACLAAAFFAACGDAPTLPTSFAQEAGGRTWVAVTEPAGMPDARTWLPYLAPQDARRIRAVMADAGKTRRNGQLEAGLEQEAQARVDAARALAHDPPAARVMGALASLREWETRAAARQRAGSYPGLDSVVTSVAARRTEAEAALERGELRTAAVLLAEAGEVARTYSPVRVALRLLQRAEQRVDTDPNPTPDMRRARRMLRGAREAMATGDQMRAMKRAWYAQQILDAHDSGGDTLR